MDCLIWPIEGDDLRLAAEFASRAIASDAENEWHLTARGMAAYRLGHYQDAISSLTRGADHANLWRDTLCDLFIAMESYRAGREAEARTGLIRAQKTIETRLPNPGVGDPGAAIQEWIRRTNKRRAWSRVNRNKETEGSS